MQDRMLHLYMESKLNSDDILDEKTKERFRKIIQTLEADPKQYQATEISVGSVG